MEQLFARFRLDRISLEVGQPGFLVIAEKGSAFIAADGMSVPEALYNLHSALLAERENLK